MPRRRHTPTHLFCESPFSVILGPRGTPWSRRIIENGYLQNKQTLFLAIPRDRGRVRGGRARPSTLPACSQHAPECSQHAPSMRPARSQHAPACPMHAPACYQYAPTPPITFNLPNRHCVFGPLQCWPGRSRVFLRCQQSHCEEDALLLVCALVTRGGGCFVRRFFWMHPPAPPFQIFGGKIPQHLIRIAN